MKYSKQIKTSVLTLMFLFLMLLTPISLYLNMISIINGQSGPIPGPDVPMEMRSNGSMVQELWNLSWGPVLTPLYEFGIDIDDSDDVYITGSTASTDAFLAKYDSLGGQYWNTTWGGASDVRSTDVEWDGGSYIYLAGDTDVTDPSSTDAFIAKYDLDGSESWTDEWGVSSNTEYGNGVAVNGTTNAYLGGRRWVGGSSHQALLVKYDTAGNPGWSRNWGDVGAYTDLISDVMLDGDYIIAGGRGESYSAGMFDAFLFKYNSSGDLEWDEVWGGAQMEILRDVDMDSSGNIYITGYTASFGPGSNAVFLVKYDSDGNELWSRIWGDTGNDEAWGMYIDDSDNIYITGSTDGFGAANNDAFIIIYDTNGDLLWTNFWDGSGNDYGREIALDSNNMIYVVGYTDSYGGGDQGFLLKCSNEVRSSRTITLNETAGVSRTNEPVTMSIENLTSGECYYDSPRVFQPDASGTEIVSQVWNATYDSHSTDYNFLTSSDWQAGSPTGWSSLIDSGSSITVLPHYDGHRKVVQIDDQTGSGGVNLYESIGSQASGTVAFWFQTSDSSKWTSSYSVKDNAYNGPAAVAVHQKYGGWVFFDPGEKAVVDASLTNVSCASDAWYHVKFTFFCSNDSYKLWINGAQAYWNDSNVANPDFGFASAGITNVEYLVLTSFSLTSGYQVYFDAFALSWGSGYAEDMEQFLTSFEVSFLANVSASSSKTYTVYYDSTSQGDPGYVGLSQSTNQITCSDGTQYNFAASTDRYFMTTTQLDKNGVDWALDATESLMFGELFGAAVSSLWLESSAIFAEVAYRYNSTQYMYYRIHDNTMIQMTHMYSGYNFFDYYYHGYDDLTFAEHLRYYKSGWQQLAAGTGNTYDACTEGKWFFDDTDDKQVILATVWDLTSETDNFGFFSDQADRFIMEHGRVGPSTFDFLVNTEYSFWFGFQDAGSTGQAAKESYVDDLYTALITDPLQAESLGDLPPAPPPSVVGVVTNRRVLITWTLSAEPDIDHYNVYRSRSPITDISGLTPIASVSHPINFYLDQGVRSGTYYYVVTSVDSVGQESIASDLISATIPEDPGPFIFIIIIIIVIGSVSAAGGTATVFVYRRRSHEPAKKKIPKEPKKPKALKVSTEPTRPKKARIIPEDEQVLRELRARDLKRLTKEDFLNKMFTTYEIDEVKLEMMKSLSKTEFSEEDKKRLMKELFSLPKEERAALLEQMSFVTNREELVNSLDEVLSNAENLEKQNNIEPAIEEYSKILSIAEGLGDDNLFQKILQKIEDLES